jgi:hypothetical protein
VLDEYPDIFISADINRYGLLFFLQGNRTHRTDIHTGPAEGTLLIDHGNPFFHTQCAEGAGGNTGFTSGASLLINDQSGHSIRLLSKTGIMEQWNVGMLGNPKDNQNIETLKNSRSFHSSILFLSHYSSIPSFQEYLVSVI